MRWPAPTIRLRLTLLYGVVFLVTGAVLLTLGYFLVRHNLDARGNFRQVLSHLGIKSPLSVPPPGRPFGFLGSATASVAAAYRAQLRAQALDQLLVEYVLALGVMTVVSVVAGWLLAGRALRPLRQITATARRVSGENLGERIALTGPADELRELADTFDGMLVRLDNAFQSQRHFVANASHELRTPLAIIRTEVEVALADPDARESELREMGEAVRETIDRCERLLESLLMLARSEGATRHEEDVDLRSLAGDCITDLRARAEELQLSVRDELRPAATLGDTALLERMIANLLDNAIRHNERGGFVEVRTGVADGRAEVTVVNGGPLIDSQDARELTEPFRRLGRSRGGFGLGLSIVNSVVAAHGGRLTLAARSDGGLEVQVSLPASTPQGANVPPKRTPRALTKS